MVDIVQDGLNFDPDNNIKARLEGHDRDLIAIHYASQKLDLKEFNDLARVCHLYY